MVYDENRNESKKFSEFWVLKLGQEKVFETDTYYHTGMKARLFHDFSKRMEEKISKRRRSLNVSTKIGIVKRSLSVWVGYTIF